MPVIVHLNTQAKIGKKTMLIFMIIGIKIIKIETKDPWNIEKGLSDCPKK